MECNHTDVTKPELLCMIDVGNSTNFQLWVITLRRVINSHYLAAVLIAQHVCHGCVQDI